MIKTKFSDQLPDEGKRLLVFAYIDNSFGCYSFTVSRHGPEYRRDLDGLVIQIPVTHYWIYVDDLLR